MRYNTLLGRTKELEHNTSSGSGKVKTTETLKFLAGLKKIPAKKVVKK